MINYILFREQRNNIAIIVVARLDAVDDGAVFSQNLLDIAGLEFNQCRRASCPGRESAGGGFTESPRSGSCIHLPGSFPLLF